ncbi:MAG TPA: class I SAM-dependent methyltransferase [Crenalkalicoccus sp.]|nr:class I SAM-dependent methyltransferase [Crenalkalicoccus sp.]
MPPESGPPCPLTGAPGAELMQAIPAKLLHDMWRWGAGIAPTPLRRDQGRIGLWRAPSGLAFFHPPVAGDAGFYRAVGRRGRRHAAQAPERRGDFLAGAELVAPGDRVLDVGCGAGGFATLLPQARYTGLDPFAPAGPGRLAETAEVHAARHPGAYDVVCAFQVLEHAADPLGLARAMARCLRPGGTLVLAMPLWPSPLTALPNNLVNLPPHHLSWWNAASCAALCERLGLQPLRIAPLPAYPAQAVLHWAARISPVRTTPGRPVRASWRWHGAALGSHTAARLLAALFGPPRNSAAADILCVATKPPGSTRH